MDTVTYVVPSAIDATWMVDTAQDTLFVWVSKDLDPVARRRIVRQAEAENGITRRRDRRYLAPVLVIAAGIRRVVLHHKAAAAVTTVAAASVTAAMIVPIGPSGVSAGRPPGTTWHVASNGGPTTWPRPPHHEPLTPDAGKPAIPGAAESPQPPTTSPPPAKKGKALGQGPKATPPGLAKGRGKAANPGKQGNRGKAHSKGKGKGKRLSKRPTHPDPPAAVPSTHGR